MTNSDRIAAKQWIWTDRSIRISELAVPATDLGALGVAVNPLDIDHLINLNTGWGSAWHSKDLPAKAVNCLPDARYVIQQIPSDRHRDFIYACFSNLIRAGYKQSVLYIRDPLTRLNQYISTLADLEIFERKEYLEAMSRERHDRLTIRGAIDLLESRCAEFFEIPLEISQGSNEASWSHVLGSSELPSLSAELTSLLRDHVSRIFRLNIPNESTKLGILLRGESHWLPDVGKTQRPLRPNFKVVDEANRVQEFRSSPLPHNVWAGQAFKWAGSAYLKDQSKSDSLCVKMNGDLHPLIWGQSSPAVAKVYPEDSLAKSCRFKEISLIANRSSHIEVIAISDNELSRIGEIEFDNSMSPHIDGILINSHSIGYTPIPKVACTSIKEFLFELMHGTPYSSSFMDDSTHVHQFFDRRIVPITLAEHRFIIVRDPVLRFLSGYSNRVMHHKELSEEYIQRQPNGAAFLAKNLPATPDINVFIQNFECYRAIATIDHHFRPISEYLPSLENYTHVYPFEHLDEFFADLAKLTGKTATIRHTQRGGKKLDKSVLSSASLNKLKKIFAADYCLLNRFYKMPE